MYNFPQFSPMSGAGGYPGFGGAGIGAMPQMPPMGYGGMPQYGPPAGVGPPPFPAAYGGYNPFAPNRTMQPFGQQAMPSPNTWGIPPPAGPPGYPSMPPQQGFGQRPMMPFGPPQSMGPQPNMPPSGPTPQPSMPQPNMGGAPTQAMGGMFGGRFGGPTSNGQGRM